MLLKEKNFRFVTLHTISFHIFTCFALSWLYAACSQIMIPLPFNAVPVSIQPLPLLLCAWIFGRHAVYAYGLYLVQGALGAPFFAHGGFGLAHLLGPTGGYLAGFGVAMYFLQHMKPCVAAKNLYLQIIFLITTAIIYFSCGLAYLAWFVPGSALLATGLYPFLLGDSLKLLTILLAIQNKKN